MAGEIYIASAETLRGRAKQSDDEAASLEQMIGRLSSLVGNLQGEWKGASANAFINNWPTTQKQMSNTVTMIRQMASDIRLAANNIENADIASAR